MNKTAIKNYAIWARVQLIEAAKQRAFEYAISDGENDPNLEIINGRILSAEEKNQRAELISLVKQKGFEQVMEEAAYTWFNRFIALRFMEVNGYLPTKVRVFTDENNEFKPQILKEAMTVDLDGIDKEKILELIEKQDNEELFKYLIIAQCNALSSGLPGMFETISNWTELLFPANLLKTDSIIGQMVTTISEEDWTDQVQIIGWLYQYYNSELKDDTFAKLKKNIKISKERIPAATQLFTPDWIVRYMVENSLGRLWYEGHPDFDKSEWKYYLDEAEQEPEVEEELKKIRAEYAQIKPEEIKVIDPCMGSGHILVYAFDVLMQIYTSTGWSERDAARSIIENNLYGLDIDDRAGQLAYFAVMMKARKHSRRIMTLGLQPNVMSIQDSSFMTNELIDFVAGDNAEIKSFLRQVKEIFTDAKEYGSILNVPVLGYESILIRIDELQNSAIKDIFQIEYKNLAVEHLQPLIKQAMIMSQKYDVVVTNPPYMSGSGMGEKLSKHVKKHYALSKSDLCNVMLERGLMMLKPNGYESMITMESWMYLATSERFRDELLHKGIITSMVHMPYLGKGGTSLGINFGTQMSSIKKGFISNYAGIFDRIVYTETDEEGEPFVFPVENEYYKIISQKCFFSIPGSPVAYWIPQHIIHLFEGQTMDSFAPAVHGFLTGHDEGVTFMWFEIAWDDVSLKIRNLPEEGSTETKYVPLVRGGEYRKWYGNYYLVLRIDRWAFNYLSNYPEFSLKGRIHYFNEGTSWPLVTSGKFSSKYLPKGYLFGNNGPSIFRENHSDNMQILGFMNSCVAEYFLDIINPTMSCSAGVVKKVPIVKPNLWSERVPEENIDICKRDWDSFETSWDFKRHPLI